MRLCFTLSFTFDWKLDKDLSRKEKKERTSAKV